MYFEQSATMLVPLTMSSAIVHLDQYRPDWQLAEPTEAETSEPRVYKTYINFSVPFANVPMVHVGLTGFDIDHSDSARLSVRAGAISAVGFELQVMTWLNTRVYKVEVSWLALGHQVTGH